MLLVDLRNRLSKTLPCLSRFACLGINYLFIPREGVGIVCFGAGFLTFTVLTLRSLYHVTVSLTLFFSPFLVAAATSTIQPDSSWRGFLFFFTFYFDTSTLLFLLFPVILFSL